MKRKGDQNEYTRHREYESSEDAFYDKQQDNQINKVLNEPLWYGILRFVGIIIIIGLILYVFNI